MASGGVSDPSPLHSKANGFEIGRAVGLHPGQNRLEPLRSQDILAQIETPDPNQVRPADTGAGPRNA